MSRSANRGWRLGLAACDWAGSMRCVKGVAHILRKMFSNLRPMELVGLVFYVTLMILAVLFLG